MESSIGNESEVILTPNTVLVADLIANENTSLLNHTVSDVNTVSCDHRAEGMTCSIGTSFIPIVD